MEWMSHLDRSNVVTRGDSLTSSVLKQIRVVTMSSWKLSLLRLLKGLRVCLFLILGNGGILPRWRVRRSRSSTAHGLSLPAIDTAFTHSVDPEECDPLRSCPLRFDGAGLPRGEVAGDSNVDHPEIDGKSRYEGRA